MKEERYVVTSNKPELVTLADGTVASMSKRHDAFAVSKDTRFRRLRAARRLKRVMVTIPDLPPAVEPEPVAEVAAATELAPSLDSIDIDPEVVMDIMFPEEAVLMVDELGLKTALVGLLHGAGFSTASALTEASDEDLLEISGIGPSAVDDIRLALSESE